MRTDKILKTKDFHGLELCNETDRFYEYQLNKIHDFILEYSLKHSHAIMIRVDLHYPEDYEPRNKTDGTALNKEEWAKKNKNIEDFMAKVKGKFARDKPKGYWAREKANSEHHHYHLFFMFRADKHATTNFFAKHFNDIWCDVLGIPKQKGLADRKYRQVRTDLTEIKEY